MCKSKNSNRVPETKTDSKNVASSKSLISRENFFRMLCLALLAGVFIFGGCDKDDDDDSSAVYLLAKVSDVDGVIFEFEYDKQNRLTKVSDHMNDEIYTLTYNSNGDLVSQQVVRPDYPDNNFTITFTKNGNIITYIDREGNRSIELDAEGLPIKYISEGHTSFFHWQNGNMTRIDYEEEWDNKTETTTLTYDDKNNPFLHCTTPKWYFILAYYNHWNDFLFGTENNIVSESEDDYSLVLKYTYNDAGFPLTQKVRECYDSDCDDESTNTFKYITK